jgi:hypothetical protein
MSTVAEIEAAIKALAPKDRATLVADLPSILPELDGDAEWDRIINNPAKRESLSKLGDEIENKLRANPEAFLELRDQDFEDRS